MLSFQTKYSDTLPALVAISITGLTSMVCVIALAVYQLDSLLKKERYATVKSQVMTAKQLVHITMQHSLHSDPADIKSEVLNMLDKLRYPDDGYFWILDKQGIMLMHPFSKGIVGSSTLDLQDIDGKLFVHDMLVTAESGGGFVTYSWLKPGGKTHFSKIAYVTPIDEWGWVLGSGSYIDDLQSATESEVYRNSAVSLMLLAINVLVLLLVSRKFINRFHFCAIKDELSGLLNRRYLNEISAKVMANDQTNNRSISLLFFDIDLFKSINDKYGHHAGDLVLSQLGSIVKEFTRMNDLSFRYGGEEFVLIYEGDVHEAERFANDLRQYIEKSAFDLGIAQIQLTVSIGVATNQSHETHSIKDLIFRADAAMYQAKAAGRNCIRVYS
ncbi:diguanylate cyclase [Marinomonas mediterranea]|uniref:cache domain-containing protein n=1 Tax=Marinomonas mediterranea TaxID=119864 RepID=UPI00234A35D1|nr:cache domain-containing protein [Marinomonas mediterranea]WCN12983.1 diguanylate cyclase [Marinomonas mediterranea]